MQQTISGSDGRYFYAIPQTQNEIQELHKGTVPFFCYEHVKGSHMLNLCLVIPNTLLLSNFFISEYRDDKEGETIEAGHFLSFTDFEGDYFAELHLLRPDRFIPLSAYFHEMPFDLGLLIQLIEKSKRFQTAMSQITPQIELAEYEYVNN